MKQEIVLSEKTIPKSFKNWYLKMFREAHENRAIDVVMEYDRKISVGENQEMFMEKFSSLVDNEIKLLEMAKIPKQDVEFIQEEKEQKELLEQQEKVEQKELELIEQIKQSKTPELDKYYKELDVYMKVLENTPTITACVIIGDAGIGKSTYIKKRFKGDTILLSGHLTAKELYLTYLEHPNSHIIIDDPSSIYANVDSLGLLLQATQTEPIRTIHWHTSTLKVPKKTTFSGKMTLIQNYEIKNRVTTTIRC